MKKLITPFLRPIALAITLVIAGSGPLCAQNPLRAAALPAFDRIYQQSLRAMQTEARAVGLRIDTDIDVLVEATSHMLLATIDGFENIVLDDTGLNEFDWGFANVAGIEGLPDDYYRLHIVVDLNRPEEAVGSFINSRGEAFDYPLEVMEDPHPERGPRKGLTVEGGALHSVTIYVRDSSGLVQCMQTLTQG
jgi:hypothetical protein